MIYNSRAWITLAACAALVVGCSDSETTNNPPGTGPGSGGAGGSGAGATTGGGGAGGAGVGGGETGNACLDGTHTCDPNAVCTSTGLGTFECACSGGYTGDGMTCTPLPGASVTDCVPPALTAVSGTVACLEGATNDASLISGFIIEAMASVSEGVDPLLTITHGPGIQFRAETENTSPVSGDPVEFYIASEDNANGVPGAAGERIGPFTYEAVPATTIHSLSAADIANIQAWQAAATGNVVILRPIPSGGQLTTSVRFEFTS